MLRSAASVSMRLCECVHVYALMYVCLGNPSLSLCVVRTLSGCISVKRPGDSVQSILSRHGDLRVCVCVNQHGVLYCLQMA